MSEADKFFEELGYKLEIDTYFGGQKNYTYKLIDENGKTKDFIRFKYDGTICTCFKTWFSRKEIY